MSVPAPHFLLLADTRRRNEQDEWRFVLTAADGSATLEANEIESEHQGERLELLSVVRGLEALEQPSRVTLVTPSRYVRRGSASGLEEWRSNDWQWESFGEMVPVKNRDLWQRLDHAMSFHRLELRTWRIDAPHNKTEPAAAPQKSVAPPAIAPPIIETPIEPTPLPTTVRAEPARRRLAPRPAPAGVRWARIKRKAARTIERCLVRIEQLGTDLLPKPWFE